MFHWIMAVLATKLDSTDSTQFSLGFIATRCGGNSKKIITKTGNFYVSMCDK